jgi:hypothetical protein
MLGQSAAFDLDWATGVTFDIGNGSSRAMLVEGATDGGCMRGDY